MRYVSLCGWLIVILAFIIGLIAYPHMPAKVASHWGASGAVNGYIPKTWGTFIFPLIMLVMGVIFFLIPRIDPKRRNYREFKGYYWGLFLGFELFLLVVFLFTILWNLGYHTNVNSVFSALLGFFIIGIGFFIEHVKPNWFIGIRTPWTLSNEEVWRKTHRLGSLLFKVSGVIALFGVFFTKFAIWLVLIPIIISSIVVVIYSYYEYERVTRGEK